jgi:hypothetical protein
MRIEAAQYLLKSGATLPKNSDLRAQSRCLCYLVAA